MKTLKNTFLTLALMLSVSQVFAAICSKNLKNTSNCPIEICVQWGKDCKGGGPDGNSPDGFPDVMFEDICISLKPGESDKICNPIDYIEQNCQVVFFSYTITVQGTGQSVSLSGQQATDFTNFLFNNSSENGGIFQIPSSPESSCLNEIEFSDNGNGEITIGPKTCKEYCFKNNTDCYISIGLTTNAGGDYRCTDYFDYAYASGGLILNSGESKCISDFGTSPDCPICIYDANEITVNVCGQNGAPCFSFTLSSGGQGYILCNGQLVHVGVINNNGVYEFNIIP